MDDAGLSGPFAEDALTTDRMSARKHRIEVITRGERRRVWAVEQKREIVLDSLQPGAHPADVARQHGINTGLLYTWRRQMLEGQLGETPRRLPSFARVDIVAPTKPERSGSASGGPDRGPRAAQTISAPPLPSGSGGLIEIVLPSGTRVRVDAQVDSRALRRVLAVLEGR